jgi:hypothetical protein
MQESATAAEHTVAAAAEALKGTQASVAINAHIPSPTIQNEQVATAQQQQQQQQASSMQQPPEAKGTILKAGQESSNERELSFALSGVMSGQSARLAKDTAGSDSNLKTETEGQTSPAIGTVQSIELNSGGAPRPRELAGDKETDGEADGVTINEAGSSPETERELSLRISAAPPPVMTAEVDNAAVNPSADSPFANVSLEAAKKSAIDATAATTAAPAVAAESAASPFAVGALEEPSL